jgi:hypothetical protein
MAFSACAWLAMVPAARAGGLRGEIQLDASISPAGLYNSDETDISADGNNVYAAWTEIAVAPATSKEIYYSRSTDGGSSWSSPVALSTIDAIDDASADVAADGNLVVVVWLHGSSLATQDVQAVVSSDAGATFGPVLDLSGYLKGDAGDADTLTVHVSGTHIYVAFADDAANPGGNEDDYVISSADSGATFSAPVRVNDFTAGTADVDSPELKASGATVYLTWVDNRAGNDHVYFDRSLDGGLTWGTDIKLDSGGTTSDADDPSMTIQGTEVHIAWTDDRNDVAVADQVFYAESTDSGVTFSPDKKIGSAALGVDADNARISAEGSSIYIVWNDTRNGLDDMFIAVSSDDGATFAGEFALDPDLGTISDQSPHLRSKGDSVFVLYRERIASVDQVWLSYSPNRGAAGTFQRLRLSATLPPANDADNEAFAVTDDRDVVGVWVDNRAGGTNNDVYANGQRFPNLYAVPVGNKLSFQLADATPSEEGQLFLAVFSTTGTNSFLLPNGMNLRLTVDWLTLLLIQPWAIPLVSDTVQNGGASTIALPLKMHGYAAAIVVDPVSGAILASTDPVSFN